MKYYFNTVYAPNNMVLVCCGNLDFQRLCDTVQEKTNLWKSRPTQRPTEFCHGTKEKQRKQKDNLVREHICLVSPSVSAQDQKRFAASLLAMIIGDYTGSRFFWELVDKAIAETAATQFEAMDGVGAMYSYIRCSPENTLPALDLVNKVFSDLNTNGITEDELQKAKNKVLSALTIRSEQPMGRLLNLGFDWTYLKQYRPMTDDISAVKSVTINQVNSLINEFNPADYTQYTIGPTKK